MIYMILFSRPDFGFIVIFGILEVYFKKCSCSEMFHTSSYLSFRTNDVAKCVKSHGSLSGGKRGKSVHTQLRKSSPLTFDKYRTVLLMNA